MHRTFAAVIALYFWLAPGILAQSTPVDRGALDVGAAKSDTLQRNEPHRYTLTPPENAPFTIVTVLQPGNTDIYGYVLDNNGRLLDPSTRAYLESTLSQVYGECPAPPCALLLEGEGSYTLNLSEGNTLYPVEEVLQPGDTVSGTLTDTHERAYRLETDSENTLTLTLTEDRQPIYFYLHDSTGSTFQPIFEHYDAISGIRVQVFNIADTDAPFDVLVSGSGKYTLQIDTDDTLRIDSGELVPGESKTESKPITGYAAFTLAEIAGNAISVVYGNGARDVYLHDSAGKRLFAETTFVDRTSLQHITVFALNGSAPYTFTVHAENNYEVNVINGDISRVDSGVLRLGMVTALDIPPGMTPVFMLETATESTVMTLIFNERTILNSLDLQFQGTDGALIVPDSITPVDSGLVIKGFPANACPCQFIPRVSGRFAISIAGELPELTMPVTLLQSEVNLRAGTNLRAPIIAIGGKDEQLTAFARSDDDAWLLAVNDQQRVVWVFRQLTASSSEISFDMLPVVASTTLIEEAEATAEPTQEATAEPVASETTVPLPLTAVPVTLLPSSTREPQGTSAAFSCMITSGGGINMRQGAGMEFPIAGSLTDGATTGVIAQSYDTDGNVWWQLENTRWVRADVVVEIGNCANAPAQKPTTSR